MNFGIPKPRLAFTAYGLATLLVFGLIGLGIAAFDAFSYTGRFWQAAAFAVVIECGMIWESIMIVRRNWFAVPGLIVSLSVSAMYNYTQAQHAGAVLAQPITDPVQLAALSIGPMSAVFFLALSFGAELRVHERMVAGWQVQRQTWIEEQRAKAEQQRLEKEERARLDALEVQRMKLEAENRRLAMAQEAELAHQKMQLKAQVHAQRASAHSDRAASEASVQPALPSSASAHADRANAPDGSASAHADRADAGATAQAKRASARAVAPGRYPDFVHALQARNGAGPMGHQEIEDRFGVSTRTAYNWLKRYAKEHATPDLEKALN